jgi:hypothetical protein
MGIFIQTLEHAIRKVVAMSDQSALLERMSTAVRTAYKAMEVLK